MKRTTAVALSCAAALALPTAARAQETPTAATPDAAAPLPALAYDTYFEPFTDNPLYRLHNPEPLTKPEPLFQKFDPLEGLTRPAKVSRITLPGDRYAAYAPVMSAVVGQELAVPISVRNAPSPMTSLRVILEYDPAVIMPVGWAGVGIPSEDIAMNPHPDASADADCQNCLISFNVLTYPWPQAGPMLQIKFRTLAPGTSPLAARLIEISDDHYNMRPCLFQDGMAVVSAH
jgi:hypothetical protein